MPRRKWTDVEAAADLRDALAELARESWAYLNRKHPGERWYAFGFYTSAETLHFVPLAAGEGGLDRATAWYAEKHGSQGREGLRWSMADSPYAGELSQRGFRSMKRVDAELARRGDPYDLPDRECAAEVALRLDAATAALRRIDDEGGFGTGGDRRRITLMIEGGDVEDEWRLRYVRRLNPRPVADAFAESMRYETTGRFTEIGRGRTYATEALAVGGRLLAAAADYHAVAFEADSLEPRWRRKVEQAEYRKLWSLAAAADGSTVAAGWNGGHKVKTGVTVWDGKGKVRATVPVAGSAVPAVALAPDGTWVAAATGERGNPIRIFGRDGAERAALPGRDSWTRSLAATPDGRLLAAADGRSVRLFDVGTWTLAGELDVAADEVAIDAAGDLLVAALRYPPRDDPAPARAVSLWDLPLRGLRRTLAVDGHKLGRAVPSPDGRLVAAAAGRLDSINCDQAVLLDAATGREVARLSAGFEAVNGLAFLPGGDVAVAVFGHNRGPVVVWRVGG